MKEILDREQENTSFLMGEKLLGLIGWLAG